MNIKPIYTEKTTLSPEVILDKQKNKFIISGKSGVENAEDFYKPILNWFIEYFKNPNEKTEIIFYLEYINSSSAVQIGKLFDIFSSHISKHQIAIIWNYDADDEIMKEAGEEFQLIYKIRFNFREITD